MRERGNVKEGEGREKRKADQRRKKERRKGKKKGRLEERMKEKEEDGWEVERKE